MLRTCSLGAGFCRQGCVQISDHQPADRDVVGRQDPAPFVWLAARGRGAQRIYVFPGLRCLCGQRPAIQATRSTDQGDPCGSPGWAYRGGRLCLNSVSLPISGCPAGFSHGSPLGGVAQGGRSPTGAMPPTAAKFMPPSLAAPHRNRLGPVCVRQGSNADACCYKSRDTV